MFYSQSTWSSTQSDYQRGEHDRLARQLRNCETEQASLYKQKESLLSPEFKQAREEFLKDMEKAYIKMLARDLARAQSRRKKQH